MSAVNADSVQRRLLSMRELVDHLRSREAPTAARLELDLGLRLEVTMALAQLVSLATEINTHVVTGETGAAPTDARDSFLRMARGRWIDEDLALKLQYSPGLRNVIVREYVRVDLEIVAASVPGAVAQFDEYIRQVAARLAGAR